MRVLITGSNSVIGRALTVLFKSHGYDLILLEGRRSEVWQLGQPLPNVLNADVMVHLAHDRKFSFEENIYATEKLVGSFPGYKILLSSLSAHSRSKSIYGRSKLAMEELFLMNGGVVRAGVVFGPGAGGVIERLSRLSRSPISLIPYSRNRRLFFSHIDDLCEEILQLLNRRAVTRSIGANLTPLSIDFLLKKIRETEGKRSLSLTMKVPASILNFTNWTCDALELNIPILDSLRSLETEIGSEEISALHPSIVTFRPYINPSNFRQGDIEKDAGK